VNVRLDSEEMVLVAEMLMNAQMVPIIVTQMLNALILLVHFRAHVTRVIQAMVCIVLTSTNAQ